MQELHPNVQLIHRFFHAYASSDMQAIESILAPDIQWIIPGRHPLSGTKSGVQQVLEYFKQLSQFSFQAEPIVMGYNDRYVIDCHTNWSNLPGSDNLRNMSCLLWEVSNGKIVRVYNFPQDQHVVDAFFTNHPIA
jgi:ketosteroid isomerase-like protein